MNEVEEVIDRIYQKRLTLTELESFYFYFRRFVVQNFEKDKTKIQFLKASFFEACRQNYKAFYLKNLKHLDYVYLRKLDIFYFLADKNAILPNLP